MNAEHSPSTNQPCSSEKRRLRRGFSTGTAAAAAAIAAVRHLLESIPPCVVAVRLPVDVWLAIPVHASGIDGDTAWASVIKDGGDDPDVTHKVEVCARVRCLRRAHKRLHNPDSTVPALWLGPEGAALCVIGGQGVGVVGKPGLPVAVGEPAINPVPRQMLQRNIMEELLRWNLQTASFGCRESIWRAPARPHLLLPFPNGTGLPANLLLEVEIEIPKGATLARHTLNPRLGISGGLSILGTTGIVKPFSHEAYEETIESALSVAASNACREVVLSTGGKSERYAQQILTAWPAEAFVQIADFYAFGVKEARNKGFGGIVHSVFFGKVLKMAQGHAYTHAHRVALDLQPLAEWVRQLGYPTELSSQVAGANTARHALELLLEWGAEQVIGVAARAALEQSLLLAGEQMRVRLLLFDYDGTLLADVS